jgi:N-acetylglucosamine kinase-like BadF-type ATPase
MILIADSGSTKTNWALIAPDAVVRTCTTQGINPFFLQKDEIMGILEHEFTLSKENIVSVYFYGAGCTPEKAPLVSESLKAYFQLDSIEVYSDLLAAARSLCGREEGIACILGTGSNSCYYDGEKIAQQVSPLGYILGDEGSGAVLGKRLVADVLKNQLSPAVIQDFQDTCHLSAAGILDAVYRQPFPNRFLAQFVPFIFKHLGEDEVEKIVEDSFSAFIRRNVLQYHQAGQLPVHFTGSVAFYLKEPLEKVVKRFHCTLGKVTLNPLPGLIEYHIG